MIHILNYGHYIGFLSRAQSSRANFGRLYATFFVYSGENLALARGVIFSFITIAKRHTHRILQHTNNLQVNKIIYLSTT